jgi:hypothetical protein
LKVINAVWVRQGLSNLRHSLSPQLLNLLVGKLLKSTRLADFPTLNHPSLKLGYVHQGRSFVDCLDMLYCGPVLRHSAELIQAANFRSAVVF